MVPYSLRSCQLLRWRFANFSIVETCLAIFEDTWYYNLCLMTMIANDESCLISMSSWLVWHKWVVSSLLGPLLPTIVAEIAAPWSLLPTHAVAFCCKLDWFWVSLFVWSRYMLHSFWRIWHQGWTRPTWWLVYNQTGTNLTGQACCTMILRPTNIWKWPLVATFETLVLSTPMEGTLLDQYSYLLFFSLFSSEMCSVIHSYQN